MYLSPRFVCTPPSTKLLTMKTALFMCLCLVMLAVATAEGGYGEIIIVMCSTIENKRTR